MDENYEKYGAYLTDDNYENSWKELSIDVSSNNFNSVQNWESDIIEAAPVSQMESSHNLTECILPIFSAQFDESKIAKSLVSGINHFAEAVKPFAASWAVDGIKTASESVWETCSAKDLFGTTYACFDSLYPDTSSIVDRSRDILVESVTNSNSIAGIACSTLETIQPTAKSISKPAKPIMNLMAEAIKSANIMGELSDLFAKAFDFTGLFVSVVDQLCESLSKIAERMQKCWEKTAQSFHDIAHWLYRYFYNAWETRPRLIALPWREQLKYKVSLKKVILPPSGRVREYSIKIRQCYLLKHQRISDDSDDLDDSYSLYLAA